MTDTAGRDEESTDLAILTVLFADILPSHISTLINDKIEENQRLEFKRSGPQSWAPGDKAEIRKDAVAMANGGGGIIIFGIDENSNGCASRLHGLDDANELKRRLEAVLISNVEPPFKRLDTRVIEVEGNNVLLLRVWSYENPPQCVHTSEWNRRFPIRQNRDTRPMTLSEIRDSHLSDRVLQEVSRLGELIERKGVSVPFDLTAELTSRQMLSITDPNQFAQVAHDEFSRNSADRPYLRIVGIPCPLADQSILQHRIDNLKELLRNPPGARRRGWYLGTGNEIQHTNVGLSVFNEIMETALSVFWNGVTVFFTPLDTSGATWGYSDLAKEGETYLNPRTYLEPIICMLALIKKMAEYHEEIVEYQFDIEFINSNGIIVSAASRDSYAMIFSHTPESSSSFGRIEGALVEARAVPFAPKDIGVDLADQIIVQLFERLGIQIRAEQIPIEAEIFDVLRNSNSD